LNCSICAGICDCAAEITKSNIALLLELSGAEEELELTAEALEDDELASDFEELVFVLVVEQAVRVTTAKMATTNLRTFFFMIKLPNFFDKSIILKISENYKKHYNM
jgi:hypothetical protein